MTTSDGASIKSREAHNPQDDYRWTDALYGPTELLQKFEKDLPLVVNITNGFFGRNEIDIISASQMVCVFGEIKQDRVLGMDRRGRLLTIPVDYPIKFQFRGKKNKRTKSRLLKDLLKCYNLPVAVTFSKKSKWKLKIGFRTYDSKSFGRFDLLQKYTEHYLIGYTFDNGVLDNKITLIPAYLDLQMKIAKGLVNGSSLEWSNQLKTYDNKAKRLNISKVKGPKDILIVDEKRIFNSGKESGRMDTLARMVGQKSSAGILSLLKHQHQLGSMSDISTNNANYTTDSESSVVNGHGPIYSVPLGKSRELVLKKGQQRNLTGDEHITRVYLGENVQPLKVISDGQYATLDEFKPRGVLKNSRLSSSTGNIYATAGRMKSGIYWGPSSASEYGTVGRASSEIGGGRSSTYGSGVMKYGTMFISKDGKSSDFGTYGDIRKIPVFNKDGGGGRSYSSDTEVRRSHTMSLPVRPRQYNHHPSPPGYRSLQHPARHRYNIQLSDPGPGYLSEPDMRPEDIYARPRKTRFGRSTSFHEIDYREEEVQRARPEPRYPAYSTREQMRNYDRRGQYEYEHRDTGHYEALDEYDKREIRGKMRKRIASMNEWKEGRLLVRINEEEGEERNPLKPVLSTPNVPRRREIQTYDYDYDSEEEEEYYDDQSYYTESETPYEDDDSYLESRESLQIRTKNKKEKAMNDRNNNKVTLLAGKKKNEYENWEFKGPKDTLKEKDEKNATYSGTVLIHSADLKLGQRPSKADSPNSEESGRKTRLETVDTMGGLTPASMGSFEFGQSGEDGWIELEDGQTIYTAPPNDDDVTNDTDHDSEQFYGRSRDDSATNADRRTSRSYNVIRIGSKDDDVKIERVAADDSSSSSAGRDSELGREHDGISQSSQRNGNTAEMSQRESQVELATSHLEELDAVLRASLIEDKKSDVQTPEDDAIIDGPAWPSGTLTRSEETRDIEDMAISDTSPRDQSQLSQRSSQSRGQEETMSISDTQADVNINTNNTTTTVNTTEVMVSNEIKVSATEAPKPSKPVQRSSGSFVMRSSSGLTQSREGTLTKADSHETDTIEKVDNWASSAFAPRKGQNIHVHHKKIELTKF